jgi:hypothetical protein
MKRWISLGIFVFLLAGVLIAQSSNDALLAKIDAQASFLETDFFAVYRIIIEKPGEGRTIRTAEVYRRDAKEQYAIYLLEPKADRGKGFIGDKGILELFDPVSRKFTRTNPGDRFQNGNARNSDFTRSWFARDYTVVATSNERIGTYDCVVYSLEAKVQGVTFPKVKLWIDSNQRMVKKEDSSLSGQTLQVTVVPEYQQNNGRWIPKSIVIEDRLSGRKIDGKMVYSRTTLTISNPKIGPQPDMKFSKIGLERFAN